MYTKQMLTQISQLTVLLPSYLPLRYVVNFSKRPNQRSKVVQRSSCLSLQEPNLVGRTSDQRAMHCWGQMSYRAGAYLGGRPPGGAVSH